MKRAAILALVTSMSGLSFACSQAVDANEDAAETPTDEAALVQSEVGGTWRFARGVGPGLLTGLMLKDDGTYVGELTQNCAQSASSLEDVSCAPRIIDGAPPEGSDLARGHWKLVRKPSWCGGGSFCADLTGKNFIELDAAFYRYEQPGNRPVPLRLVFKVSQPLRRNSEMSLSLQTPFQLDGVYGRPFPQIEVTLKRDAASATFCATSEHCNTPAMAVSCMGAPLRRPVCNASRTCECVAEPAARGYGDACNTRPDHGAITPCLTGMSCRETNLSGDADVCRAP